MEKTETNKKKIAEEILRLRFSQVSVNENIKNGKFRIPIHLAMGHEAIAVAISSIMTKTDNLVLSHRNIAYNLARQGSLRKIMDEYLLKSSGLNQGRSGSMNLANPEKRIVYTSSILGNNYPVGTGVAMADRMVSRVALTIVLGGDGSIEEGSFYESLILAKTMGLSLFFVTENNEWSLATKIEERRCHINLASLARAVGIKYAKLSGNDVYKYIVELRKLKKHSLYKREPVCIEVNVSTLGDWRGPATPQYPKGKFINYHAGASPSVNLINFPIIKEDSKDPVFVLTKYFKAAELSKMYTAVSRKI